MSIKDLIHTPQSIAETVRQYLLNGGFPVGRCVVCNGQTRHRLINQHTRAADYVCGYDDPGQLGCKQVWRYWQQRDSKETKVQWMRRNYEDVEYGYIEVPDDDCFLDDRDHFHDYRSYIASREWEIKADEAKRLAGMRCAHCGVKQYSRSDLDAHHKHYRTLYHECRHDIEVLCRDCHRRVHGK